MPRRTRTVKVEAVPGEKLVYRVESWSQGQEPHRVDLLGLDGNGECSCKWFATTCAPNYRANGGKIVEYGDPDSPNPQASRCRHVAAALRYFTNHLLKHMATEEKARKHAATRSIPFGGNRVAPEEP